MTSPLEIYTLGQSGVVVDVQPLSANLPPDSLRRAQNAALDLNDEHAGALKTRTGLARFNLASLGGAVLGGIGMPVAGLGGAPAAGNIAVPPSDPIVDVEPVLTGEISGTGWTYLGGFGPGGFFIPPANDPIIQFLAPSPAGTVRSFVGLANQNVITGIYTSAYYLSSDGFIHTGMSYADTCLPIDPRDYDPLGSGSRVGNMQPTLGGGQFQGKPSCTIGNVSYTAANEYLAGAPTLYSYDAATFQKRELGTVPPTYPSGVTTAAQAIVSMLAANGKIYIATLDVGSGSGNQDQGGSVYEYNPITGYWAIIGTSFPAGYVPYCLAFMYGMLWVGVIDPNLSVLHQWRQPGAVYYNDITHYPPQSTNNGWVLDHTCSAQYQPSALIPFQGQLYVAEVAVSVGAGGTKGIVEVRSTTGAYTTAETGSDNFTSTSTDVFGYWDMVIGADGNLYVTYGDYNNSVNAKVRKYTGSAWTTALTTTSKAPLQRIELGQEGALYTWCLAGNTTELWSSPNGITWTNRAATINSATPLGGLAPVAGTYTLSPHFASLVM